MVRGLDDSGVSGVSECGDAAIAVDTGLICCHEASASFITVGAHKRAHLSLSADDVQHPSPGHDLRDVAQAHRLLAVAVLACGAQLHLQSLHHVWVQASAAAQLRELMRQLLHGFEDLGFEDGEVQGFICRRGPPWLGDGRRRVGAGMGFVGLAGLLLDAWAGGEGPRRALRRWGAWDAGSCEQLQREAMGARKLAMGDMARQWRVWRRGRATGRAGSGELLRVAVTRATWLACWRCGVRCGGSL
jgi:hypothetical protein